MAMSAKWNMPLKALTEDDINEAFEKTRNKFKFPGIGLVLITEQYIDKALKLHREHFLPHEPLCKAVDLQWSDMIEEYMIGIFKQHLSLMFVDEKNGEPIAFRTICIISRDEPEYTPEPPIPLSIQDLMQYLYYCDDQAKCFDHFGTDEAFRFVALVVADEYTPEPPIPLSIQDLMQYLYYCDDQAKCFDHFGTDEAFRFVALVVADEYKRRGLASQIFHAAIDMIRNFGFEQAYIKGEGTSNFAQKIYEKEGFGTLYENIYDTWEVDGRHPFTNTGEHKSIKIYGRGVKQK